MKTTRAIINVMTQFLIMGTTSSNRWTGLSPWKRREYRLATGKCPTSPKRASGPLTPMRSFPKVCTIRAPPSQLPPWPVTWPWGTCRLSATLDTTCFPRPPLYTRHLDTRTTQTWWPRWAEMLHRGSSTEILWSWDGCIWGGGSEWRKQGVNTCWHATPVSWLIIPLIDCKREGPFSPLSRGTKNAEETLGLLVLFYFIFCQAHKKNYLHHKILSPLTARIQHVSTCAEEVYIYCEYCKCVRMEDSSNKKENSFTT